MRKLIFALVAVSAIAAGFAPPGALGQRNTRAPAPAAPEQPYFGLTLESYGELAPVREGLMIGLADSLCPGSQDFRYELETEAKEGEFQDVLRDPLARRPERTLDPLADTSLVSAELISHFSTLSARTFWGDEEARGPTVAILSRDDQHITFWRMPMHTTYRQTRAAARDWCERRGMTAVVQGQSRQCAPAVRFSGARLGPATGTLNQILQQSTADERRRLNEEACNAIYGQRTHPLCPSADGPRWGMIQPTYAITHFSCAPATEGERRR